MAALSEGQPHWEAALSCVELGLEMLSLSNHLRHLGLQVLDSDAKLLAGKISHCQLPKLAQGLLELIESALEVALRNGTSAGALRRAQSPTLATAAEKRLRTPPGGMPAMELLPAQDFQPYPRPNNFHTMSLGLLIFLPVVNFVTVFSSRATS